MSNKIALAVRDDISEQMASIKDIALALQDLSTAAENQTDESTFRQHALELADRMAAQLRTVSRKAYEVGTKVIDNAAA